MNFLHAMIRVNDLDENLDFFCNKLEMVQIGRKDFEEARFSLIFLTAKGDAKSATEQDSSVERKSPLIELTYNWPSENEDSEIYKTGRAFGHLAFKVKDIYKTCERLMNLGVTINRPPRDGYMTFIKSPEGISIELLQEGEPLKAKEPWVSMQNIGSW